MGLSLEIEEKGQIWIISDLNAAQTCEDEDTLNKAREEKFGCQSLSFWTAGEGHRSSRCSVPIKMWWFCKRISFNQRSVSLDENPVRLRVVMSTFAASIPEELITDILLRLPAKSVGQFRKVSKPWQALLSNPAFIKTHLNCHTDDQEKLLLLSRSHALFTLTFNTTTSSDGILTKLNLSQCQDNWVDVVGSCNGLALVVNEEESKYLINPTTSEHVKLSNSPVALDPRTSFSMHGFGYDSVNDDYKIVTLSYYDTDSEDEPDCTDTFVDVYSAKTSSWRRLGSSPFDHTVPENDSGVFVNGALHWLACTAEYSSVIAAFNLATEEFDELPPPATVNKDRFVFKKLVVFGGCLCMVDDRFHDHIDVWMMKEYGVGESWTKFSINGMEYFDAKPFCPLGNEVVAVVDGEKLLLHNLKEKTSRDMVIEDAPGFEDGVTFRESLISPNFSSWNEEQHTFQGSD